MRRDLKPGYAEAIAEIIHWVRAADETHDPGVLTVADFMLTMGLDDLIDNIINHTGSGEQVGKRYWFCDQTQMLMGGPVASCSLEEGCGWVEVRKLGGMNLENLDTMKPRAQGILDLMGLITRVNFERDKKGKITLWVEGQT